MSSEVELHNPDGDDLSFLKPSELERHNKVTKPERHPHRKWKHADYKRSFGLLTVVTYGGKLSEEPILTIIDDPKKINRAMIFAAQSKKMNDSRADKALLISAWASFYITATTITSNFFLNFITMVPFVFLAVLVLSMSIRMVANIGYDIAIEGKDKTAPKQYALSYSSPLLKVLELHNDFVDELIKYQEPANLDCEEFLSFAKLLTERTEEVTEDTQNRIRNIFKTLDQMNAYSFKKLEKTVKEYLDKVAESRQLDKEVNRSLSGRNEANYIRNHFADDFLTIENEREFIEQDLRFLKDDE